MFSTVDINDVLDCVPYYRRDRLGKTGYEIYKTYCERQNREAPLAGVFSKLMILEKEKLIECEQREIRVGVDTEKKFFFYRKATGKQIFDDGMAGLEGHLAFT